MVFISTTSEFEFSVSTSVRKRQVIGSYQLPSQDLDHRKGTYWGVRSEVAQYPQPPDPAYPFTAAVCAAAKTLALANLPTRLKAIDDSTQERLINWGYTICDLAMRVHIDSTLPAPKGFPYPQTAI